MVLCKHININQLQMGQFIDLEHYLKENNIIKIASYMYEPQVDFDNIPYEIVLSVSNKYLEWRNNILDHYRYLFTANEDNEYDKRLYDHLGIIKEDEDIEEDNKSDEFNKTWMWYHILYTVFANENFLKMKVCYSLSLISVLNHLAYLNVKQ